MTLNNRQIQLLRNFVKKVYDKAEKDYQEFDVDAIIDRELSYQENKRIIKEKLKELGVLEEETSYKQIKDEVEAYNRQVIEREIELNKIELEKDLEKLKNSTVDLSSFYGDLKQKIDMVKKGYIRSLFVIGEAGCGKTTFILRNSNENFVRISGHISPLSLYLKLYENKDGKIIFFDDTDSLLQNQDSKTIIKQATDTTDKRVVMWNTTKDLGLTPNWFVLTSNVIFALNVIPEDITMKAIISRAEKVNLEFSWYDYIKMMVVIAKKPRKIGEKVLTPEERQMIVDYIKENSSPATENFSLRTQFKIENYYAYDPENWKLYANNLLGKEDEMLKIVEDLIKSGKSVEEQIKIFNQLTNKSRRTYFRYKKKLSVKNEVVK